MIHGAIIPFGIAAHISTSFTGPGPPKQAVGGPVQPSRPLHPVHTAPWEDVLPVVLFPSRPAPSNVNPTPPTRTLQGLAVNATLSIPRGGGVSSFGAESPGYALTVYSTEPLDCWPQRILILDNSAS
jgi:hypothetical protein